MFFETHFLDNECPREAPAEGAPLAGKETLPRSAAMPRVVTTGRKKTPSRITTGIEDSYVTGERITLQAAGRGTKVIRHVDPLEQAQPAAAFVDALAFTVVPPDEQSWPWVLQQMQQFLPIAGMEKRNGIYGFKQSARLNDGAVLIAWGGASQRGRVYFSLMGAGCSMIENWSELQSWLEQHQAKISRVDLAHDDFEGQLININWATEQYNTGGFNAGGRKPRSECAGDWLNGIYGRTLYIGSRAAGKLLRIYEKGKQLGDLSSPWTRAEVEWRAQDRVIPYDILTKPGQYLAGAYPCLIFLERVQSVIKTVAKAAQTAYETAVDNAKRLVGKTVNLMLNVSGGDYVQVVELLIRPGFPKRIEPYSYHVKRNPLMLDRAFSEAST